ncbi:MAG: STAS domain-containing protein [Chitinophagales bacterium]|nr:STAS domain-containing protein [Chitinophagaceae bacterium]MCB9064169.1 STAS domain-containing protein [Chitinophagales bacterium]
MEFKYDTKPTYIVITPAGTHIDANMTASLRQNLQKTTGEGNDNYIIDLQNCSSADNSSLAQFVHMHNECYENGRSLVFTAVQDAVLQALKEGDIADEINIAPTMQEAVDIISMEILERDLLSEE